uniref:Uncharacterized protein n=1 Tax=Panagrolaimus davidi TaxID=227884 RepID=A0A914QZQ0_9BILA
MAVALMSLLAGLLALCSPETKDKPMPEDINDFDPGEVYRWIFGIQTPVKKIINEVSTNPSEKPPLLSPPNILIENNEKS